MLLIYLLSHPLYSNRLYSNIQLFLFYLLLIKNQTLQEGRVFHYHLHLSHQKQLSKFSIFNNLYRSPPDQLVLQFLGKQRLFGQILLFLYIRYSLCTKDLLGLFQLVPDLLLKCSQGLQSQYLFMCLCWKSTKLVLCYEVYFIDEQEQQFIIKYILTVDFLLQEDPAQHLPLDFRYFSLSIFYEQILAIVISFLDHESHFESKRIFPPMKKHALIF